MDDGQQQIYFDSNYKLRVVEEDKFRDTVKLEEECKQFTEGKLQRGNGLEARENRDTKMVGCSDCFASISALAALQGGCFAKLLCPRSVCAWRLCVQGHDCRFAGNTTMTVM